MTPRINHASITPPTPKPKGTHISHDPGLRMQALAMVEFGIPIQKAAEATGITISTIYRIRNKAIERGYDRDKSKQLFLRYVVDSEAKGGRPRKDRSLMKREMDKKDDAMETSETGAKDGFQDAAAPEAVNGVAQEIVQNLEKETSRDTAMNTIADPASGI